MLDEKLHIAHQVRAVERVKAELLQHVASLYQGLLEPDQPRVVDHLAGLILLNYVLARRLGIPLHQLERAVREKAREYKGGEEMESWYGDFSILEEFFSRE